MPLLRPGGLLLLTLKFPGGGRDRAELVGRVTDRLVCMEKGMGPGWQALQRKDGFTFKLDTACERTLVARRVGLPPQGWKRE